MVELRRLAKTCHIGQFLNDALRNQLVCGLIATNIQKRLLSEANLTAERALEISQAMETVEKGAKGFKEEHQDSKRQETETAAINVVSKPVPNRARPSRSEEGCTRCAGNGHNSWNCPYRGTQCHKCKRVGHLVVSYPDPCFHSSGCITSQLREKWVW